MRLPDLPGGAARGASGPKDQELETMRAQVAATQKAIEELRAAGK